LILPSLEPVAARMAESGQPHRILPALSLLFKFEFTCVLAIMILLSGAGADIVRILSRPAYAPYYYILPVLLVGLVLNTVYRILETLGSMNLSYSIFLKMWPLSILAVTMTYLTVGTWGLVSVLAIPIVEMIVRVAILVWAFRHQGVGTALDPARSVRIVVLAVIVWGFSSYVQSLYGGSFANAQVFIAACAALVFLSAVLLARPISPSEYDALSKLLPTHLKVPNYLMRVIPRP
jgi:hypothetical protein